MGRKYRYDYGAIVAEQTFRGGWEYRIKYRPLDTTINDTVGYVEKIGTRYYPWTAYRRGDGLVGGHRVTSLERGARWLVEQHLMRK